MHLHNLKSISDRLRQDHINLGLFKTNLDLILYCSRPKAELKGGGTSYFQKNHKRKQF